MWKSIEESLDRRTVRYRIEGAEGTMSFEQVTEAWQNEGNFRAFYTRLLAESPFEAFFWETPPVRRESFGQPFEFVLVQADGFARITPEPGPFETHFAKAKGKSVLSFQNLGGDAMLVVPAPLAEEHCYTHLARFLRSAPAEQVDEFWQSTAAALVSRLSDRPVWLSTAGMGVSWLHLRIDSRPKYYRHVPYTREK